MPKTRKVHSPDFKARVAVDAIRGLKTASELASQYQVHPVQISQWKKHAHTLLRGFPNFSSAVRQIIRRRVKKNSQHRFMIYEEIGRLKIELDWLKKICRAPQGISGC